MDVEESEWIEKATERIDLYLNRGGVNKGDDLSLLGGTELLNTIGVAMHLQMQDPNEWTEDELRKAQYNQLVYFNGTAREGIDVVANQIKHVCSGDNTNFITVLPIELYHEGKLYEVPLFRVQRYRDSPIYYVDNIGRSYTSVNDWYEHCKLPAAKMAYPHELKLKLNPEHTHAHVSIADTPPARPGWKAIHTIDTATTIAGIGASAALLFVSGGLATPLLLTAIGSTIWNTTRAGYELVEKGTHGESVNPFTDSQSRMLWLGIAANLISFGAIGASWRLSSLALRGQRISNAFRIFVSATNTTNLAVNGIAIVDSTLYLIDQYNELTKADILILVASIAFWTRDAYTYKSVTTLIREAHDVAFKHISSELTQEQVAELSAFRNQFQGDEQLLREYQRAARNGISQNDFSQILIDGHLQGRIQLDGAGNLILPEGHSFSFAFLSRIPRDVRLEAFNVLANLTSEQAEVFKDFRQCVNDDLKLITGISRFGVHYNLNARQATENIINFWREHTIMNLTNRETGVIIVGDTLVLGTAPPIKISQLPELSSSMVQFLGEHLSRIETAISHQWSSSSVPVLLKLQDHGMFTVCPVTSIIPNGRAVVSLNNELHISIYKLNIIPADDSKKIFSLIGQLPSNPSSFSLPTDVVKLCVQRYRFRLECQRKESVQWLKGHVKNHDSLRGILTAKLQSFEKDRLYTFKSTVDTFKVTPYMEKMMTFIAEMNPRNISEMVSYGEFAVKYVETEKLMVEQELRRGTLQLPRDRKKADWTRQRASEAAFRNVDALKQKFNEMMTIVKNNNMVGVEQVSPNLSDEDLVAAIREKNIKFGSDVSAAYHIYKHPVEPYDAYITRANETIRSSADRYSVTLAQDGDARFIAFENETGSSILLERDGRVLLCTFSPKKC